MRFVEERGFKIEFAVSHLEETMCVYLGLQASELESNIPKKLEFNTAKMEAKLGMYKAKTREVQVIQSIKDLEFSKINFHGKTTREGLF